VGDAETDIASGANRLKRALFETESGGCRSVVDINDVRDRSCARERTVESMSDQRGRAMSRDSSTVASHDAKLLETKTLRLTREPGGHVAS
jgi:hypothetical protein